MRNTFAIGDTKAITVLHTDADKEPRLTEYFVKPPFFDGVAGDPAHPSAAIVFAPRGGGKSAQRRELERWCTSGAVLAVTYDRFEFAAGQRLEDISLAYHIRNIIIRVLISYLSYLSEYPNVLRNLSTAQKKLLSTFAHSYLGDLTGLKLQELLRELKSLPEKMRKFWSDHVGILDSVVNVLLKKYGLENIDLSDQRQEQKKLSETYKHQLEVLLELVRQIGFRSIYILVDKIDESEKTGNNPDTSYTLLHPLLTDLELLGLDGYGFKFFAWDQIQPRFSSAARPDRVPQYSLSWSREALENVLAKRISALSNEKISCFADMLSEQPGYNVDRVICLIANRSPRNVTRICEKILTVQAELDREAAFISPQAVERGIDQYCIQVAQELYGEEVSRDLQRTGRELFTINYLASEVFKQTHENTSRNRVTKWGQLGLVRHVNSVSIAGARRPLNFYYVTDPAMIRLIHRSVPLKKFLEDRWLPCAQCGADNLMDLNLIPEGNDALCHGCGRPLL